MNLFNEIERTERRPMRRRESIFSYLNKSAREEVAAARTVLQQWLNSLPVEAHEELISRLKSPIDHEHLAAFWELYLYELFSQLGYKLEIHPTIEGSTHRPDFLVCLDGGPSFYMEAVLAGLPSKEDAAADVRLAEVFDLINEMPKSDYFLYVRHRGLPKTPPPVRKLRKDLAVWLESLSVDGGDATREARSEFTWSHDGLTLFIRAIRKSIPSANGRPIGFSMGEARWVRTDQDIRDAIEQKANRYGKLSLPLIVAVNVVSDQCEDYDIFNALFGSEVVEFISLPEKSYVAQLDNRQPNGVWSNKTRKRYVSAVLIGCNVSLYNCITPVLIHNPNPLNRLVMPNYPLPQAIADNETGMVRHQPGRKAADYLRLPSPWPPRKASLSSNNAPQEPQQPIGPDGS